MSEQVDPDLTRVRSFFFLMELIVQKMVVIVPKTLVYLFIGLMEVIVQKTLICFRPHK